MSLQLYLRYSDISAPRPVTLILCESDKRVCGGGEVTAAEKLTCLFFSVNSDLRTVSSVTVNSSCDSNLLLSLKTGDEQKCSVKKRKTQ